MIKPMLMLLGIGFFFLLPGCANQQTGEDALHGSAGVQVQSRDTSRFAGNRSPY